MDYCEPIEFKASSGERTVPWQYSDSQRVGTDDMSAVYAILDEDVISESTVADTLAAKWWVNQIPSGLPYENYLRELYYEEWHTSAIPDQKVEEEMAARENLMRAQRLVYVGLSGTPVGSVSGDPMLDPNWSWKDNRTPIDGLGTIPCDGRFNISTLFCVPEWPDNSETINELWELVTSAEVECSALSTKKDELVEATKAISADFVASAQAIMDDYNTMLSDITNSVLNTINSITNSTNVNISTLETKINAAVAEYKAKIPTLESVQEKISALAASAEQTLLDDFTSIMDLEYAISECEDDTSTATHEIERLLPPKPAIFTTSTNPSGNEISVPQQKPGHSAEAASEPAEGLPGEPPEPHIKSKINWWLWLMDILITILNKIMTTVIAVAGLVVPIHSAAAALLSAPLPSISNSPDTKAASIVSVAAMQARMVMAGAALSSSWFNDQPVLWIYPPLMGLFSSVNILASKSKSFFDPEPAEYEDKSVDFEVPEEEPEWNLTGGIEAQSARSPLISKKKMRAAVLASVSNYNDRMRAIFRKYNCTASLWLFNRYHSA